MLSPVAAMVLLALLNLSATTDRMIFGVLAPVIQPAFGLSDAQLGLMQGPAYGLAYAAALPLAGWLVDRVGRRRALVAAILLWSAGLAICAGARGLTMLVIGRGVTGLGQAALLPTALGLIAAGVDPARRGRATAIFTGAGTLGRNLAFALGGALLGVLGPVTAIPPWSIVLLILIACNALLLRQATRLRDPTCPDGSRDRDASYRPVWRWLARHWQVMTLTVVAALGPVLVIQVMAAWVTTLMTRYHGLTPSRAGMWIGAIGLVAAPAGHLIGGMMTDRSAASFRTRRVRWGQTGMIAAIVPAAIGLAGATSTATALIAFAALIVVSGAAGSIGLIEVQRLLPPALHGRLNGLFLSLTAIVGISGGPALVGWLSVPLGGVGVAVVSLILASAAVSIIASLAAHLAHRPVRFQGDARDMRA